MPWSPADAKKKYKRLSKKQSEVWSKVANSALEAGDDEATAIKKANAAVNRMRKSEAYTEAAVTLIEIGRSISAANMKKMHSALKAMQDAMDSLKPLIADDSDEAVESSNVIIDTELDPVLQEAIDKTYKWESARFEEAAKILAQSDSYDSIRYAVQSALRKRAISDSLTAKVNDGSIGYGYDDYYDYGCMPYIRDLYDGYVVYSISGELYQCDYTLTDDEVVLGDPTEVKISYVPVTTATESKNIEVKGDLIQFTEKAVRSDGTVRIKLISPGWGSSGYYSKEVLQRDGPKVFPKGTHMYMNHPTEEEDRNRPERDVKDLAGVIISDTIWEDKTPKNTGPGLYADAQVFSTYSQFIDEAAQHIGTSIRAAGTAIEGEAENRHGLLVDSLKEGYSVDYVTIAGRGGQVLPLYESVRSKIGKDVQISERTDGSIVVAQNEKIEVYTVDITQEELQKLRESAAKTTALETQLAEASTTIARMHEAMIVSEARTLIASTLSAIELPNITRERLVVECARNIPLNEDKTLNREQLIEKVKAAAIEEMKYLESVTGSMTGGKVTGMTQPVTTELNAEEVNKNLEDAFADFGLNETASKIAAIGRYN